MKLRLVGFVRAIEARSNSIFTRQCSGQKRCSVAYGVTLSRPYFKQFSGPRGGGTLLAELQPPAAMHGDDTAR